ncbi:MAG: hypothetical protein KBC91_07815 [Candidatus Omnitrophica bacterium]|nr:hypothetical protein [Candidatus Omnitrophota bacterium]
MKFRIQASPVSRFFLFAGLLFFSGCAALFGWKIHAPGLLSQDYYSRVVPSQARVALYLPEDVLRYQSTNRGGALADPQTYFVGEAFVPMILEGFQRAFQEFVFFETEPNPVLMRRYGIQRLAVVRIRALKNRVTLKGQAVQLETETRVYNEALEPVAAFESIGTSDAKKVFSKKGGPEINLNFAIENNVTALVQYLQEKTNAER